MQRKLRKARINYQKIPGTSTRKCLDSGEMECSSTIQQKSASKILSLTGLALLAGVVLLLFVAPLHASSCSSNAGGSNCEPYNDAGSSPNPPSDAAPKMLGSSVDIATGNNYQGELDFKTGDSFLSFKRHYNSVNAGFNLGLGAGWRSTFDVSLAQHSADRISIIQSDGRIINFQLASSRLAKDSTGHRSQQFLPSNSSDGVIQRQGAHHIWQLPDKRTLHFKGRFLTHIEFAAGHSLRLFYKNQKLSTVTDEAGRQLRYQYTEGDGLGTYQQDDNQTRHPGHLERIILPDDSAIEFFYDRYRNLIEVIQPDGTKLAYRYQDGHYPGFLISSSEADVVKHNWHYHADGTVASYRDFTNAIEMILSYFHDPGNADTGHTLVTGKKGNTSRYEWNKVQVADDTDGVFQNTPIQITSLTGDRCIGCPDIKPESGKKHRTDNINSVVLPSSIQAKLEQLKAKVLSSDSLGYPEKIEFDQDTEEISRVVELDFSARGKLESIQATLEDGSEITFSLHRSTTDNDRSSDKQATTKKPKKALKDMSNDLRQAAEILFELALELDDAGDFDTRNFKEPTDDYSGSTDTPPGGSIFGPTPGNPPLCTADADCDAIDRAQFYYDFSHCAYVANRPCENSIADGWEYVDPAEAGPDGSADISEFTHVLDFDAAVFYNEAENRVIISFSGTDHFSDLVAGYSLIGGDESYQGEAAIELALRVRELYPDTLIETTGHSLGGGLAILAASILSENNAENVEGVVFGSIGIDEQSAEAYNVAWNTTDQIDHFFVEEDIVADPPSWHLSIHQSDIGLVYESNRFLPARAETYELSQPPGHSWSRLEAHQMANIQETLEYQHSELNCE